MGSRWICFLGVISLIGCGDDGGSAQSTSDGTTSVDTTAGPGSGPGTSTSDSTSGDTSTSTSGSPKLDVDFETSTSGGPIDVCKVQDEGDAPPPCDQEAPPNSFEPEVQWTWGENPQRASSTVPLVANLTDDNDDGEIDLCDIPDVVLSAYPGEVVVLDGATGSTHWTAPGRQYAMPALGDIDDDGLVEILIRDTSSRLMAYNHDGSLAWTSAATIANGLVAAPALADIDNDGDVEIVVGATVMDHLGNILWTAPAPVQSWSASAISDLDGDDDMEILMEGRAYHHDGSLYYDTGLIGFGTGVYSQVADLDFDGLPEVLISHTGGVSLVEHDGTVKWSTWGGGSGDENRPVAIHDHDGDDEPEFGASALMNTFAYGVYEPTPAVLWTGGAVDSSGQCGGTAFDFLGDGVAEAIYADETVLYVYDDVGGTLLTTPRSSLTQIEYPVVADVDNDGSAEILVVSNPYPNQLAPGLQVIRDVQDRWIPARRIWNQHTYHVTNVREDGTIPQVEPENWSLLNTYRTQAQVGSGGGVCKPEG